MTETKLDYKEFVQIEFGSQWKGVIKDYPLIASIFMTPDKESQKVVKGFLATVNLQD